MEKDEKTYYAPKITSLAILIAVMDGLEIATSLTSSCMISVQLRILTTCVFLFSANTQVWDLLPSLKVTSLLSTL